MDDAITKQRVFDLHCDTLDRLVLSADPAVPGGFFEHDAEVPRARMSALDSNDAHISLERTSAFSWCQCFAVFVPDELFGASAWDIFVRVQRFWEQERLRLRDKIECVSNAEEYRASFEAGKTAGMLTVEGCSFLEDDGFAEERLDDLAAAGVRVATLTWNGANALGSGNDTADGLTSFGVRMMHELERRGIVVDVSHLNEPGFRGACEVAARPFIATHSNARAICGHPRNLADWQLREIAERGGIVGLNFYNGFLRDDGFPATTDDVLRHVDHILEVAGPNVLALGSDYDGSDVPEWLEPCSKVQGLYQLLEAEFGRDIAEAVFHRNAERFFGYVA